MPLAGAGDTLAKTAKIAKENSESESQNLLSFQISDFLGDLGDLCERYSGLTPPR